MGRPLTDDWRDWLRLNRDRGCDRALLYRQAADEGFDPTAIALELGTPELVLQPAAAGVAFWQAMVRVPLTTPGHCPRACRFDTDRAQIYAIPDLLSPDECIAVMAAIDAALEPSTVTNGPSDYRTSRTCHLVAADAALADALDARFAALIGVDPALAEPLQGQRYDQGQYFKAHTDWFAPGTPEFEQHTRPGGQRTWTLMVYLNTVEAGGETVFERLGQRVTPKAGLALAWNNLHADGSPNHATLHEAMPVAQGVKYVITKWFRAEPGRLGF
jgi:prolyl 4-hydroxylase